MQSLRIPIAAAFFAATLIVSPAKAFATGQRAVNSAPIVQPPQQPLDARIDLLKVTQGDLPPLPERVLLPVPPALRIARDPASVPISSEHWKRAHHALETGLKYLQGVQGKSGGWLEGYGAAPTDSPDKISPTSVAITALAVKAIAQSGIESLHDAPFADAVRYVTAAQRDDGAFEGGSLSTYVTSAAVMALASVGEHDYHDRIQDGAQWLMRDQWDQGEGLSAQQDWFGGCGYGNRGRPDLSNTQMMMNALYEAGISPDEPAMQKALAFASRAQNFKHTNPSAWAGDDGGFVYTPANGGESFASEAAGEGRFGEIVPAGQQRSLRSYGSMTYAGFKSMFYAGLSPDDPRVKAAFDWIRRHWTFEENPGLGQQGLYYYYHAIGRALYVAQQSIVEDAAGNKHNWREEFIDAIAKRQREDGSWKNEADRWMEGEPVMATIDALLALEEALKPIPGAADQPQVQP